MSDIFLQAEAEARTLRHLVDRQDFAGAHRSVERYVKLVDEAIPLLEAEQAACRLMEARALVDWARRNLRAAQARLSEEVRRAQRVSRYHSGGRAASHILSFDL